MIEIIRLWRCFWKFLWLSFWFKLFNFFNLISLINLSSLDDLHFNILNWFLYLILLFQLIRFYRAKVFKFLWYALKMDKFQHIWTIMKTYLLLKIQNLIFLFLLSQLNIEEALPENVEFCLYETIFLIAIAFFLILSIY